jgi:hypothetical protein
MITHYCTVAWTPGNSPPHSDMLLQALFRTNITKCGNLWTVMLVLLEWLTVPYSAILFVHFTPSVTHILMIEQSLLQEVVLSSSLQADISRNSA